MDLSEERVSNAKKISDKIDFYVGDVSNLSKINDVKYDFMVSNQVIEHVSDDALFVRQLSGVLRKDGFLFISTVFKKKYGWFFYRCNNKWVLDPTHVREYTNDDQLLSLFASSKLKVIEKYKHVFWFPFTDFIFKRIGLKRDIYNNRLMKLLRNIKVPIIGYYNWEILLQKVEEG